jgi:hypothetical protein
MIQAIINLCISILCAPVLSLIKHLLDNGSTEIQALWVGICLACLINGIVCLTKE